MSLLAICQAIQDSAIAMQLRGSTLVWPAIEAVHVLSLSLSVGMIALVDLRLIGAIMPDEPFTDVIDQTKPWTTAGFALAFITGVLLFWSEAGQLYSSYSFRFKLGCIALLGVNAFIFHSTIFRAVNQWNQSPAPPRRAQFAGWFGIIFWAAVIFCGRWTAYHLN
jgi:hypothetical protein